MFATLRFIVDFQRNYRHSLPKSEAKLSKILWDYSKHLHAAQKAADAGQNGLTTTVCQNAEALKSSPKSPQEINFGGWHLCRKCQKPVTNGKKCSNCGDF